MIGVMDLSLVLHARTLDAAADRDGTRPLMDEAEFCAFYERTARPLLAYLSRLTRDPHRADDLLQETYYRFYRAASTYEDETHRRNALFHIATNLARDAVRRDGRWREVALADDVEPERTTGRGGEARREMARGTARLATAPLAENRAVVRADLERALGKLAPLHRAMLWLAYAQGASHEEIAAALDVRPGGIGTTLLRARRKLAGLLGGEAGEKAGGEAGATSATRPAAGRGPERVAEPRR